MSFFFLFSWFVSCGLVSLGDIDIATWPETKDQVLAAGEELWVEFSIMPDKADAESLVSISGGDTGIELDFRWEGMRMYVIPLPELPPGLRFVFSFSGVLHCPDGRHFDAHRVLPFFAGSSEGPFSLLSVSPEDGADASDRTALSFTFNRALNTETFKKGFQISPNTAYGVEFSNENTTAEVIPEESWGHHLSYVWDFSRNVKDSLGVPLAFAVSGGFIVQEDKTPPEILSLYPVFFSGGLWLPLPGLGKKDSLLLEFSEDPDMDSLLSAFSIEPSVNGTFRRVGLGNIVFTPEDEFIMDTDYTVRITRELADLADNHLTLEFAAPLRPDIPEQEISEIRLMDDSMGTTTVIVTPSGFRSPVPVEIYLGGVSDLYLVVEITFLEAYEEPYREALCRRIGLKAFFPPALSDPSLVSGIWNARNTVLTLEYEGFEKSEAANPPALPVALTKLYKLIIPGGKALSENQNGSYLRDDVWVLMRAEE